MNLKSQNRFDDGTYCSPIIGIEGVRYKFYADTFETYRACDIGCMTTKGLYKIIGNKIQFYPIKADLLKNSIIRYTQKTNVFNDNSFTFHVKFLNNTDKIRFGVWFFKDSIAKSLMTLYCYGDTLIVHDNEKRNFDKILVGGLDLDKEQVYLKFDKKFFGEHIFDIIISDDNKHYIDADDYSLNLVSRSKTSFSIIYFGDTLELRNEKFITNDFLNSWINKQENDSPINTDFEKEKAEFEKEK